MRIHPAVMGLAILALLSACDAATGLLSEDERQSMYSLSYSSGGAELVDGGGIVPGSVIGVELALVSGAAEPAELSLQVLDAAGKSLAELRYQSADGSRGPGEDPASAAGATTVASLSGSLPSFSLPADLPPGIYRLRSSLTRRDGTLAGEEETLFFSAPAGFGIEKVDVYPPDPAPGAAILLAAHAAALPDGSGNASALDPWIRWSVEGRSFAEGFLSGLFDQVVWRAPANEGAYGILVELFPARPGQSDSRYPSPWRREVRVLVKAGASGGGQLFADPKRFAALLLLDGDFTDRSAGEDAAPASVTGRPGLAAFPGGFGYKLGPLAALSWPERGLPAVAGVAEPFSLLLRLSSTARDGSLAVLQDSASGRRLGIGLEGGYPYLLLQEGDRPALRSTARSPAEEGSIELMASFLPASRGEYELVWTLGGRRFRGDRIPAASLPTGGSLGIGGPGSLPGIYEALALSKDRAGGPPPFLAETLRRSRGSDLLLAWGFESPLSAEEGRSQGELNFSGLRLLLGPGASLRGRGNFSLAESLTVEADLGAGTLLDLLAPEGNLVASLDQRGAVFGPGGESLGLLPGLAASPPAGRLSLSLRAQAEGILLSLPGSDASLAVSGPASLGLGLRNPLAGGAASTSADRLVVLR